MVKPYEYNKKKKKSSAMQQWLDLPEHTMGDVIDDVLYVNDPPFVDHQSVVVKLTVDMEIHNREFKLGTILPMETGVFIDDRHAFQPDLLFVAHDNRKAIILPKGIVGPPDLVIEIWSPGTKKKDQTIKKEFFERIGVQEYWMVDPTTKDSFGYFLENGKYSEPLQLNSKIQVRIFNNKTFNF